MALRYNGPKIDEPKPPSDSDHAEPAGEGRTPLSSRRTKRAGFGIASFVLHAAVIGALMLLVTRPLEPPAPDEMPVELVFEQPAPPPEPAAEVPPETPPLAEKPPEPPLPEPPPEPAVAPPPEPPAIIPPPPPPPPRPSPPRPRPPARPVERPQIEQPVSPAVTAAPRPAPVAPVVDAGWQAAVSGWLAARKTYPEEARRRGEEGRVAVRFTVDRSGRVVEAAIVSPSGSALLDEAALGLLRQAVLPAFPADMTADRITITTTMRYSLR